MCSVCECVFSHLRNNGVVQFLALPLEGTKLQIPDVGFFAMEVLKKADTRSVKMAVH